MREYQWVIDLSMIAVLLMIAIAAKQLYSRVANLNDRLNSVEMSLAAHLARSAGGAGER